MILDLKQCQNDLKDAGFGLFGYFKAKKKTV